MQYVVTYLIRAPSLFISEISFKTLSVLSAVKTCW